MKGNNMRINEESINHNVTRLMKDYYFKHRNEHDESWQGGFAKCMNLIPKCAERRTDERSDLKTGGD